MKIEILTNPCIDHFIELVRNSKEQLLASPFIKSTVARMILNNRAQDADIRFMTSFKLTNFYRNSSDIEALKSFMHNNVKVRNYPRLHAKTYIFDSDKAIITSANLTLSGLKTNYECGILVQDTGTVGRLRSDFIRLFSDIDTTAPVTEEIISTTEQILLKVPTEKRITFEKSERDLFQDVSYEPEDDLYDGGVNPIRLSLSGWRLDVFDVITAIAKSTFSLDEVYTHEKQLQQTHPQNLNVKPKMRQQLQELRDLGLIEFLGGGIYRKLWKDG